MKSTGNRKRWLAAGVLVVLTPVLLVAQPKGDKKDLDKKRQPVAEGGSAAGYLLTAAAMCLGGLFVRSAIGSTGKSLGADPRS